MQIRPERQCDQSDSPHIAEKWKEMPLSRPKPAESTYFGHAATSISNCVLLCTSLAPGTRFALLAKPTRIIPAEQFDLCIGSNQASATRSHFRSDAWRYPATIRIDKRLVGPSTGDQRDEMKNGGIESRRSRHSKQSAARDFHDASKNVRSRASP
jgi:hypothetical protein